MQLHRQLAPLSRRVASCLLQAAMGMGVSTGAQGQKLLYDDRTPRLAVAADGSQGAGEQSVMYRHGRERSQICRHGMAWYDATLFACWLPFRAPRLHKHVLQDLAQHSSHSSQLKAPP